MRLKLTKNSRANSFQNGENDMISEAWSNFPDPRQAFGLTRPISSIQLDQQPEKHAKEMMFLQIRNNVRLMKQQIDASSDSTCGSILVPS